MLASLLLLAGGWVFAQAQITSDAMKEHFTQGNSLFRQNRYDEAIDAYTGILRRGFESAALYYNLGNCYFKKEELGRAVLYYERARLFVPHDSDLRSNYQYCRLLLNLQDDSRGGNWFIRRIGAFFKGLGIDQLTVFLSMLYLSTILILILGIFLPAFKGRTKSLIAFFVALLFTAGIALYGKVSFAHTGAVVVAAEGEVKFEPQENATTYFTLGEGSTVEVIDVSAGWYKIRRADGKIGWLDKNAAERIIP